jgi:hypothetical protein
VETVFRPQVRYINDGNRSPDQQPHITRRPSEHVYDGCAAGGGALGQGIPACRDAGRT